VEDGVSWASVVAALGQVAAVAAVAVEKAVDIYGC